jgi:hypothetical protein
LAVASTAAASIIGVVKNITSRTIGGETRPVLFRSLDEASWFFTKKIALSGV